MDCERIRDRFSSLWEKELTSLEEKEIRGHLSSCPECRREFEKFEKTMQWLHSVEEVEVPDGFLPELHEKIKERKSKATPGERSTGRWFKLPISVKFPAQAVAMVAIVFLVLYVSKMMPTEEVYRLKESKQTSSVTSPEQKSEQVLTQKEADEERKILEKPAEAPRLKKDLDQVETSAPAKERLEAPSPLMKAEAKKEEAPSPKNEIVAYQAFDSREQEKAKTSSAEPDRVGKGLAAREKSVVALKPLQEIVLKISDREKAISRLHELIKQFGGEVVGTEGNMYLASMPTGSLSEFEKEVTELSSSSKKDKLLQEKQAAGSLRPAPATPVAPPAPEAKRKEAAKLAADSESRTTIRILFIQE